MPLYDFRCEKCRKEFEISLSLTEREEGQAPEKKCPDCHSKEVLQIFSKGTAFLKSGLSKSMDTAPCGAKKGCGGGNCSFS